LVGCGCLSSLARDFCGCLSLMRAPQKKVCDSLKCFGLACIGGNSKTSVASNGFMNLTRTVSTEGGSGVSAGATEYTVRAKSILGGLHHEYSLAAA